MAKFCAALFGRPKAQPGGSTPANSRTIAISRLALALLLSAAWLQAQEQYPQTGSSEKGATASGQTTVQGCLQGSDGNYTLTDNSRTTYQLQGDNTSANQPRRPAITPA